MSSMFARPLCLLAFLAATTSAFPEEDDVVVLTPDNFDAFIAETPTTLIEFYAPWCGHCKELTPKFAEAAKRLKRLSPPIPIAKVDADAHKDLASRFDVTGYPSLKIFQGGAAREYEGPREAAGIVKEMSKLGDYTPPVELNDAETVGAFAKNSSCLLIGFFRPPVAASAAYKTYISSAFELSGKCTIAWSASGVGKTDPVADALELPAGTTPGLLLLSKGKKATMKLPRNKADFTTDAITEWVDKNI